MVRDLARLATEQFDVAVIGGGVYGLTIAWELATRGVRTALVERGDFSAATSFNSLKTIHGGIRPLQHGAVPEMRRFVRERRTLARVAPHLVRVLPFVVPTLRHPIRNATAMGAFLRVYDTLARDRNDGVDPSRALPPSRIVRRDECLRLNPFIAPDGVTGGAIWHDYQMHSPERFAVALLESAIAHGAAAANHATAESLLRRDRQVTGVRVRDEPTGTRFDLRAAVVANAAGPWAWELLDRFGVLPASPQRPGLSLAVNLVMAQTPGPYALGGLAGSRFLFAVPWRDRVILGTSHEHFEGGPDGVRVQRGHIDALLRDARAAFPRAALDAGDVSLVHRGLLPASARGTALLTRSIVHDHRGDGVTGLVTIVGVRYTTARDTAQQAADTIVTMLGRSAVRGDSATRPLIGGDIDNVERYTRDQATRTGLDRAFVERLVAAYGTRHTAIGLLIDEDPVLGAPLGATCPITRAEILHAVRHEMAVHLADALVRRTGAGAGGHPGADAVAAAAALMSVELGWSRDRTDAEAAAVDALYAGPP